MTANQGFGEPHGLHEPSLRVRDLSLDAESVRVRKIGGNGRVLGSGPALTRVGGTPMR